jgi:hypothetical protein
MRERIWKYQLKEPYSGVQTLRLPVGTRIIHVDVQKNVPTIWGRVGDGEEEFQNRDFETVLTGPVFESYQSATFCPKGEVVDTGYSLEYVGTFQLEDTDGSPFVGHIFERRPMV